MLMNALIGTGDEILLPSPCYSLWSNNAYLCGGKPVFYRCDPLNEWNPDIEDIRAKVTDRTKAILVINPNNPTGAAELFGDAPQPRLQPRSAAGDCAGCA